ncbi:MAG: hypothetical protein KA109_15900 [Saprospiraceae bacterium]|jgi:hypothetical protein|nr:hypothetical protein [Saprospiraceae bacterium]MBK6477448.1 hypothetical protein [Saprospiraceae bacterium]MBK6816680.1 hypothetical protein [Saprospiraceae bacterium]MBK7371204.1 hypothetical protein [Saprospiraceae bacterium]MBK7436295.1 hypothetical protein [Saprospiraceae bacterium]
MGSVKEITMTGDNDPQIEPEEYTRHYMYCDQCGSFNLQTWLRPGNHGKDAARIQKIEKISDLAFKSTLIALIVVVLLIVFKLIMTGQFTISFWANSWLMVSLIVVLISNSIAQNLEKKIGSLGLRCGDCHATYAHKSKFFTDLDANPMNKTILLVPKPRNKVYWIKR